MTHVAAIMLTNPNTCGLFERDVLAIAEACTRPAPTSTADGANFNAIVGKVRPGDLGVDAMHINLHKTFSTPHGGGGPAPGRWSCPRRSLPSRPVPYTCADAAAASLVEHARRRRRRRPSAACAPSMARWACSCAPGLHAEPRRRRPAPGRRGRGAQRQLRHAPRSPT